MVVENDCNTLCITDLLVKDFPRVAEQILDVCETKEIQPHVIYGANDYWCRDFMPVQVDVNYFIQFSFDPGYYKKQQYAHLKTDITGLNFGLKQPVEKSNIVLDGGNICYHKTKAIITDRVIKDNPGMEKNCLLDRLAKLLKVEVVIIIPTLPHDSTGHSDSMIRFIDQDTLFLNDFRLISGINYWKKLLNALRAFNLILMPNDLHLNRYSDDATGDYINMVLIKNVALIPFYDRPTDNLAYQIIKKCLPGYSIVPIPSKKLAAEGGVLHCATWSSQM